MRTKLTVTIAVAYALLLAWQHFNGGVPAHHLLARADLPSISNWWGLVSLPLLAWLALGRIERRQEDADPSPAGGFTCALLFGALLAFFFAMGRGDMCEYLVQGLPLIALLYPVYRAECVLGFVLGMTHTFGPVLPIVAAAIFALGAYVLFHGIRLLGARVLRLKR
ncbi:hypothetical protein [Massilia niastensis]|uniref:hypothetical protein n=1 Tax=Massilia niastensis TaxID=544911 RepID=UPI000365BFE5|nr:hypothetical protein [Massilia niastensis]